MRKDLAETPLPPEAVPHLRYLRRLVTGLALVMGGGIVVIVALLWLRLSPAAPVLPDNLTLPAGEKPAAVTIARGFAVIVTESGEILLYDAAGRLAQRITLPAGSPARRP